MDLLEVLILCHTLLVRLFFGKLQNEFNNSMFIFYIYWSIYKFDGSF